MAPNFNVLEGALKAEKMRHIAATPTTIPITRSGVIGILVSRRLGAIKVAHFTNLQEKLKGWSTHTATQRLYKLCSWYVASEMLENAKSLTRVFK